MKIKVLEPLGVSDEVMDRLGSELEEMGHTFSYCKDKYKDEKDIKNRIEGCNIAIVANSKLPEDIIEDEKNLEMISVAFTGIDHIGIEGARERDITITNAAGYSDVSVAELVIGLTINLMRNVVEGDRRTRNGGTIAGIIGSELREKKIGIVGCGRIGLETGKLFKAFGCEVVGYDLNESEEFKKIGSYTSKEELLKECDLVSLHLPLLESTKKFIGESELKLMRKSALLINCARGGVIDNEALGKALNNGEIAGAGVDVFDMEPPIPSDYPLVNCKNILLTPHVAYASEESMVRRATIAIKNVVNYLKGNPENIVKY